MIFFLLRIAFILLRYVPIRSLIHKRTHLFFQAASADIATLTAATVPPAPTASPPSTPPASEGADDTFNKAQTKASRSTRASAQIAIQRIAEQQVRAYYASVANYLIPRNRTKKTTLKIQLPAPRLNGADCPHHWYVPAFS